MKRGLIAAIALFALTLAPMAMAKNGQLPPGLQKKAAKGQQLPPGWESKLKKGAVLDEGIFHAGVVVNTSAPSGSITLKVDSRLLQLDPVTRKILDILN